MKLSIATLLILIIAISSCETVSDFATTQGVVDNVAKSKDCKFGSKMSNATETNETELIITVGCDTAQLSFYTHALYQVIQQLKDKNIEFDHYEIGNKAGQLAWEVDGADFGKVVSIIETAEKAVRIVENHQVEKIIPMLNTEAFDQPDSIIIKNL